MGFIEEISVRSPLFVANCTYSKAGQYQPFVSVFNSVNRINQSIQIRVANPSAPFKVKVENYSDISPRVLITIQSLEPVPFEGLFNFTIMNSNLNVKNSTITERIQLVAWNNYIKQVYINITTYGQHTLFVSGDNASIIRQAQAIFMIGTDIITSPQVYIINAIARVNEDIVWIDIQWINGIGFDIEVEFDIEHRTRMYYGQLITTVINRTMENFENGKYWRRIADRRVQIGFRYSLRKKKIFPFIFILFSCGLLRYAKSGTYQIGVTFIQPSSKVLSAELRCSTVEVITQNSIGSDHWCTSEEFHLSSSNALNNVSSVSPVLLLPENVQHKLELPMACSTSEFIYSYYTLAVDKLPIRTSHRQTASNQHSFEEEFLSNLCSDHQSKFSYIIEQKSLTSGYYLLHITIQNLNSNDFRHYIQPIEIVHSNLSTTFDFHQTIMNDGDLVKLDFLSTINVKDQQRLNLTLLCYPESSEKHLFTPNGLQLGSSRSDKLIPWEKFNLIIRRPDLNFYFYEHQCLSSGDELHSFTIDPETREMNINEQAFILNNRTLHFDLIMHHRIDGHMSITRRILNKRIQSNFNRTDLNKIEIAMTDFDRLIKNDSNYAIEIVEDLAEKLNEISRNSVSYHLKAIFF